MRLLIARPNYWFEKMQTILPHLPEEIWPNGRKDHGKSFSVMGQHS
jgi:hypothetical protein